jgi:hypothetical protein
VRVVRVPAAAGSCFHVYVGADCSGALGRVLLRTRRLDFTVGAAAEHLARCSPFNWKCPTSATLTQH